jgi:nicotinate-nucleotide pyrophosphorylase (carboxylating)
VECDTLAQVDEAVQAGADIILLDNMKPGQLRECVQLVRGRALPGTTTTEASGGVNLETIRAIAEAGVDFVSVGRITQSAPAADVGLDWS